MVKPENFDAAKSLRPIHERPVFGRSVLLFDGLDREKAAALGEVRRPSIADVFVAVMSRPTPGASAEGSNPKLKISDGLIRSTEE